ncbi:cobalt-zinc-cadmium efflux system membrane fusion protein [Spirosoma oryzae]|uniref:Cobalt-zinc-cadmium efflux system membrane fusion protein n=1 Tax=Spirosoma oryzae TaxID=1469603 RepID=A0A2T0TEU6_9BACT|nr:efflux RND transporter periplasmic adaptor subunit [Spirosoma oryzae]PRY44189.1 cobalt-zinc-cadmium efflux system membrane fusion protein [Spirosoma oryzae]
MSVTSIINLTRPLSTLLVGITLLTACQSGEKSGSAVEMAQAAPKEDAPKPGEPVRVSLTQAQYTVGGIALGQPTERMMSTRLKVNGVLDVPAQNQVSVSVPFGGYIRSIDLEPGMRIRKGQTLVVLENPDYIQLQQDYLDTKARLEYADLDFARQQELSRDNVNALKVFQQTRANRQSLQAQLAGMTQRLALLHINPATLTPATLTRTIRVPAPVSGFVTDIPVNNGRYLNPADVLVQISDLSHPHVRLSVFEKDISSIRLGQIVQFSLGGSPTMHRGEVFLIGKSIAPDRTISVLVHPDGPPEQYIPGSYISAQVDVKNRPLPTLPEAAVVSFGGKHYVYVLENKTNGSYAFQQVAVTTGVREKGYVAVTLPATIDVAKTPIVVNGAYNLLAKLNNSEEEE